jgi:hypothetical protein
VWEAWGRDTDLMRTLTIRLRKYAAAVNHHLGDLPRAAEPRGSGASRPSAAAAATEAVPPAVRPRGRAACRGPATTQSKNRRRQRVCHSDPGADAGALPVDGALHPLVPPADRVH